MPTLWIISGPSCAGKSHFLASPRAAELTGLREGTRVWFPKEIGPGRPAAGEGAYVHYNLLRPAEILVKAGRSGAQVRAEFDYRADPQWQAIVATPHEKRAVVVVTRRDVLMERVRTRAVVEHGDAHQYGGAKWLAIYDAVDVDAVYRAWDAELARLGIPAVRIAGDEA